MHKLLLLILFLMHSSALFAQSAITLVGKPELLLESEGEYYMKPVWAPDGRKIAFTGVRYTGLYVISADGRDLMQITDESAAGFAFQWSSDSHALLTRVAHYDGPYRYNAVKIFDLAKGEERQLTDYRTSMPGLPRWADDDEKVVLFAENKLEVFDSGITKLQKATTPKSKNIYFLGESAIAIGTIDEEEYELFRPLDAEHYLNLAVSPDGDKVAFEVYGGNLYVMNSDGTGLVDLGSGNRPQWAPDNTHLVYSISEDDGHTITASDLYTISADGTGKRNLTRTEDVLEMNPSWSPEGDKIAYDAMEQGSLYIITITFEKTRKDQQK